MSKALNILTVICHDLGRHLGCYGQPDVRSTNIDVFAESGTRFTNSFCTAPQCSPSRAALWTGRYPHANGVVGLTHSGFANDLHPDEKHFAQILRAAGYETHLFGIQHEARTAERCGHEYVHGGHLAADVATRFEEWMGHGKRGGRPFFAQVEFAEPHRPFPHEAVAALPPNGLTVPPYLPDIPEVREDLADIEASIVCADRAFGRIVSAIRRSESGASTLVLFTADHGIAFPRAKMTLYDPGIEVPLILAGPGITPGAIHDELISNVEIMPTLLELAKLPAPSNLHGRSFAGLLARERYTPNGMVFAEKTYHTYYDPMRAARTRKWKLIANFEFAPWQETSPDYKNNAKCYVEVSNALNVPYDIQYHPPFELYDIENDPYEKHNLADDPSLSTTRNELIQALYNWMRRTGDPLLDGPMAQGAYRERMKAFARIASCHAER